MSIHKEVLKSLIVKMKQEKLPLDFINHLSKFTQKNEGIADLLNLWLKENDRKERDEIIADLQDEIEELQNGELLQPSYMHFDNLERIAESVLEFKQALRVEIDRWGGVTELAKETGIPLPSLSRFLNTPALPRRITLEKIARALRLKESDLLKRWIL